MSVINLQVAKDYLDVWHDDDDAKLQRLLNAAEDEALQYMDRNNLVDWDDCCSEAVSSESESEVVSEQPMPPSVELGILILLQAAYQATPADQQQLRNVAEVKLMPYRCKIGV